MKDKNIILRVSQREKEEIRALAERLGCNITDLVLTGIDLIRERVTGVENPRLKDVWRIPDDRLTRIEEKIDLLLSTRE